MGEEVRIEEVLNPKSKLLLLIGKIIEEEGGEIEKDDLVDLLLEDKSVLSISSNYKDKHSAKLCVQHHLEQLEREGVIESFYDSGVELVRLKKQVPSLSLIRLDKVFSNNVIVASVIVCMILFAISLFMLDFKLIVVTSITLFMSLLSYFTYKVKLLF